jgi:hypothetical protein
LEQYFVEQKTMVKYETGVAAGSAVLKKLEGAFQRPKLDDGGSLYGFANKKNSRSRWK